MSDSLDGEGGRIRKLCLGSGEYLLYSEKTAAWVACCITVKGGWWCIKVLVHTS